MGTARADAVRSVPETEPPASTFVDEIGPKVKQLCSKPGGSADQRLAVLEAMEAMAGAFSAVDRGRVENMKAMCHLDAGRFDDAYSSASAAVEAFLEAAQPKLVVLGYELVGETAEAAGRPERAASAYEDGVAAAQQESCRADEQWPQTSVLADMLAMEWDARDDPRTLDQMEFAVQALRDAGEEARAKELEAYRKLRARQLRE